MRAIDSLRRRLGMMASDVWRHKRIRVQKWVLLLCGTLVVLAGIAATVPEAHTAAAQLMYIPILLAAAVWGLFSAVVVGVMAAVEFILYSQGMAGDSWIVQSSLYVGFAAVSALVLKDVRPIGVARGTVGSESRDSSAIARERVLESLARTVEVRDHHTQGHCRRVAKNSLILGQALELSSQELDVLHWAALLHDIGKIAVPEYILLKNGKLSEDEFAEIRRHPAYGADLLASVSPSFRPIADIVRAHHERWDGFGYPLGYRGEEIPRLARIIAIVDVFEALTSERPYRSPMSAGQALSYVSNGAGTQFDPEIVPIFKALVDQDKIECGSCVFDTYSRSRLQVHSAAELMS